MPELVRIVRIGALALSMLACSTSHTQQVAHITVPSDANQVERGRYIAIAGDCAACHDDPNSHQSMAGGRPIETPFGKLVASNITPDDKTGIGLWTDDQFEQAIRDGVRPDGKRLYPGMPYAYFTKMSAADVQALHAYLKTVPAVNHKVVSDQLPFPLSIRASARLWDALYFDHGEFQPDTAKSEDWNRGAYLVQGLGHCGACHTPKNWLGGDKSDQAFEGYVIQNWFAPNITNDAERGLGTWSENDVAEYLKKGHNRTAGATSLMAEEIENSSSKMTDSDLHAIAVFLKSRSTKPVDPKRVRTADEPQMAAGGAIYQDVCSGCHKSDGTGVSHLIPSLAASSAVASRDPTTLLRVVIEGAETASTSDEPTAPQMPAYGWQLNDVQIAAVVNYVRNSWGKTNESVSEKQVHDVRKKESAEGSAR